MKLFPKKGYEKRGGKKKKQGKGGTSTFALEKRGVGETVKFFRKLRKGKSG